MTRPRLLVVPSWTEVEWTIRPQLDEWAEVASFDPISQKAGGPEVPITREEMLRRGLNEIDRQGWERLVIAGDIFGATTAAMIAAARPEATAGIALGHACLDHRLDGDRAPLNREVYDAMAQLMQRDVGSFIRVGITQITQGSFDEDVARQMVNHVSPHGLEDAWALIADDPEPIGDALRSVDAPLLLAKHDGCLMFTDEGFEDIAAAFPEARTASYDRVPAASEEFVAELRSFVEALDWR